VLCFGCLFLDAMGTATWARREQVSKHCSKPLSTMGMDKDEASLLQADIKLHSKMHGQEDYTPSEDEKSKHDSSLGKRDHNNGKSRADTYTKEKGKQVDDYREDTSEHAKDEKSKYDNYHGKRDQTKKHDGKSRADSYTRGTGKKGDDYGEETSEYAHAKKENAYAHAKDEDGKSRVATYTREKGKRGDDYGQDMSDYAHAKEDDSYAYAKDEKRKYDNHPGKRDRNKKHDGNSRADTYTREKGKRGHDYGEDMSDYEYPKDEKSKYDRNHGKNLPHKNYDGKSHVAARADYKDTGDFGEVRYGEGLHVQTSDYANVKEEKSNYDNYHDKPGHGKQQYSKSRANAYAKDDDKSVGNYREVRYGEDHTVKTGDYTPAKKIEYKYEAYNAKRAKTWKSWPKWKGYFGMKGRIAKHRNLRTLHGWMQAAQAIPVDAHEYCSFYGSHFEITEGPGSTPITKHDCESRIADIFAYNTQRFKNVALTWIKPNAVIARFDLFWCTLPCAGQSVVCGKRPVRDTAVLFQFNKASHIRYQEWFYDKHLLPKLQC